MYPNAYFKFTDTLRTSSFDFFKILGGQMSNMRKRVNYPQKNARMMLEDDLELWKFHTTNELAGNVEFLRRTRISVGEQFKLLPINCLVPSLRTFKARRFSQLDGWPVDCGVSAVRPCQSRCSVLPRVPALSDVWGQSGAQDSPTGEFHARQSACLQLGSRSLPGASVQGVPP